MKIHTRFLNRILHLSEKHPTMLWLLSISWLGLVCGLAFLWRLGDIGLVDETEPLFAEAARQMTVTGDWITPYFNGVTRFDKPPLIYWYMAIAYKIFGVNEWAVRLPSALSAIALTIFSFLTLRRFTPPTPLAIAQTTNASPPATQSYQWIAAWIGATVIALNLQTILWARIGVSDALLSACIGLTLMTFFWGYAEPANSPAKSRWYLTSYALTALAVLTKGPIGLVLPGLAIALFLLYVGQFRTTIQEMRLWQGVLIFLALTLPWYVLVTLANGDAFIEVFFGYHNFQRFTRAVNNHAAPWFFYFGVVLVGFAPWSMYLPSAISRLQFWRPSYWQQQHRSNQLGIFALSWFITVFSFFTLAETKLPSYVLPLIPAASILIALLWVNEIERSHLSRGVTISNWIIVIFWTVLATILFNSADLLSGDPAMPNFPDVIQQSGILTVGTITLAIVVLLQLVMLLRQQGYWFLLINAAAIIVFIIFTVMPLMTLVDAQRQQPLRQIATTIVQEQLPSERIVMVGFSKPSVAFYTQLPINYTVHPADLAAWLHRPHRPRRRVPSSILVLGLPRKLQELKLKPNEFTTLEQAGAYTLIRVKLPLEN
jgi:4-amino-4-deoxy-L-arabinose transferase-like glycosyltransferase